LKPCYIQSRVIMNPINNEISSTIDAWVIGLELLLFKLVDLSWFILLHLKLRKSTSLLIIRVSKYNYVKPWTNLPYQPYRINPIQTTTHNISITPYASKYYLIGREKQCLVILSKKSLKRRRLKIGYLMYCVWNILAKRKGCKIV